MEEGRYGTKSHPFTGMIIYGGTEGFVENAVFVLKEYNGVKMVGFESGTWVDGVWEEGFFNGGVWKNGIWKSGLFSGDVWENGVWHGGLWRRGDWRGGTGKDEHVDDNSCFLVKPVYPMIKK